REVLENSGQLFEIHPFDRLSDILAFLNDSPADLIVAEHTLPSDGPVTILDFLSKWSLKIPFVLVTDVLSEENALDLFVHGADDYVLSDRLFRLPLILRKINERRRLEEEKAIIEQKVQANEKRFRAILEHGANVFIVIDTK